MNVLQLLVRMEVVLIKLAHLVVYVYLVTLETNVRLILMNATLIHVKMVVYARIMLMGLIASVVKVSQGYCVKLTLMIVRTLFVKMVGSVKMVTMHFSVSVQLDSQENFVRL